MSSFSQHNELIHQLVDFSSQLKDLTSIEELLGWDQETYLSKRGSPARARQLETLSGIIHDRATAKQLEKLLLTLEAAIQDKPTQFTDKDISLVREMKREYTLATKLPKKLVQDLSKQESLGLEAWREAREKNDFVVFAPNLKRIVELKRQVSENLGYEESPYDALLDIYEAGLTKKEVDRIFTTLKSHLNTLISMLTKKTASFDTGVLKQTFEEDKLWNFSMYLLRCIGFDLDRGRQDISTHPFTMGLNATDVRLTTRIIENNPISTLLSTIHEAGHGMYEQGIAMDITHTTLGYPNSLVLHESQSRFWENMIGKSEAFWEYVFPEFVKTFPLQLKGIHVHDLWSEANVVKPSLIRVDADEVTYHMHIIIRTEIESRLIEGTLQAEDVPSAWNEGYQKYLGITVPNDRLGALQDIHWSQGLIGYFPTYSLGSIFSAQLYDQILLEHPDLTQQVREGNFKHILEWLNQKIHIHGRQYSSLQIAQQVTGKPISSDAFIRHIQRKFQLP